MKFQEGRNLDEYVQFLQYQDIMLCCETISSITLRAKDFEMVRQLTEFVHEICDQQYGQLAYSKMLVEAFDWMHENHKEELFKELNLQDAQWVACYIHHLIQERLYAK